MLCTLPGYGTTTLRCSFILRDCISHSFLVGVRRYEGTLVLFCHCKSLSFLVRYAATMVRFLFINFFFLFFFFRLWRLNYFKATSKASSRISCEICKFMHLKENKMFWEWCVIVFFISLLIINESSWLRLLSCYILPGWLTWVIFFFLGNFTHSRLSPYLFYEYNFLLIYSRHGQLSLVTSYNNPKR